MQNNLDSAKNNAELAIVNEQLNRLQSLNSKHEAEIIETNKENKRLEDELLSINKKFNLEIIQKANRIVELGIANEEKAKRVVELGVANEEKAKRVVELGIANQEKEKREKELIIANKEKEKRAAELIIANEERVKEVAELVIAKLKAVNNEKLQLSLMETIEIARQLVELRDPYTAGHEKHVGDLAKAISEQMGFDKHHQEGMMVAGFLHDLGKIVVPVEILCKPGALSPEEYNLVKNHVQAGYELLKRVSFPWTIARPVLEHHERVDGSGYPNHLKADQISIEGYILAVADVVDAMSSNRPYRLGLGIESALAEIERGSGSLYNEKVAKACVQLFREKSYKISENYN